MKSVPLATAAQIYHRFFQETDLQDYDPHVSICHSYILTRWYSSGECGYSGPVPPVNRHTFVKALPSTSSGMGSVPIQTLYPK